MAGEEIRQVLGIDGTAGDAQDVDHPYVPTDGGACLVCGLAVSYRRHTLTWAEATRRSEPLPPTPEVQG